MARHLLILDHLTTGEWADVPLGLTRERWEDTRSKRSLKTLLRAFGLVALTGLIPLPAPGAMSPAHFVARYLLEGEGCQAALPADVAALEGLVAEAGRLALSGRLILTEDSP